MKSFHIIDGPPLYTNCFLLVDEGETPQAAVVDPAAPAEQFVQLLEEQRATLTHIFLTHGHHDHIGSVEALRSRYNAKLYMNGADARQFNLRPDVEFEDTVVVNVGGMKFIPYFTPGHTPGSTCILCGDLLFAGDTLFAGDIGRVDLPGGNSVQMKKSLARLVELIPDAVQVLPGHEEFSTMGEEKRSNPYLQT